MSSTNSIKNETRLGHFLADKVGEKGFSLAEEDLQIHVFREINLQEQMAQATVCHDKIPGLAWILFMSQVPPNQYQPRIAFDFPAHLRADCSISLSMAGAQWRVQSVFEGSSWITNGLAPKTISDRFTNQGNLKKIEIIINITKIWFKNPMVSCCCFPIQTKVRPRQSDFTTPDLYSDVQVLPNDPEHRRRLHAHTAILGLNSPVLYEQMASSKSDRELNLVVPYSYDQTLLFLQAVYPNSGLEISRTNVEDLMETATSYQVTTILLKCEMFLYQELESGSPILVYYLAQRYQFPKLQNAALMQLFDMTQAQLQNRIGTQMKNKSPEALALLFKDIVHKLSLS